MSVYIKVGSITNAQRARSLLMRDSIQLQIIRTQDPKPGDGCGYAIKINEADKDKAFSILERNSIRVLGEKSE